MDGRLSSEIPTAGISSPARPGLYGFAVALEEADGALAEQLTPAPPGWPALRVRQRVEPAAAGDSPRDGTRVGEVRMDERTARVELGDGGEALMCRDSGEALFRTEEALGVDELVHPMLGYAALAFSDWMGREAFHAGVFLSGGGAWALLGERGSGKSSTLAWLSRGGEQILADDLLFLDGRTAFVGPRTIDLASATAAHLGLGEGLEQVRRGFRLRLALAPLAPEHRLAGWVSLAWGDRPSIEPVPAARRLELLTRHGHHPRGEANWSNVLSLASLPTFELRRPRGLESLGQAGGLLLEATAGAVG